MADTGMKYIGDYGNHWRVKIRTSPDHRITIQFNFEKYGGKQKALKAALICRQMTLKTLGVLSRLDFDKSPDLYAHNSKTNPIIGVYQTQTSTSSFWTTRYSLDGVEFKRHFSIAKYGNETAFLLACKTRFNYVGRLYIINRNALPCLPNVDYRYRIKCRRKNVCINQLRKGD